MHARNQSRQAQEEELEGHFMDQAYQKEPGGPGGKP